MALNLAELLLSARTSPQPAAATQAGQAHRIPSPVRADAEVQPVSDTGSEADGLQEILTRDDGQRPLCFCCIVLWDAVLLC